MLTLHPESSLRRAEDAGVRDIAVVIPAYNRPAELSRLLGSVMIARGARDDIPVIVSVDGDNRDVIEVARFFAGRGVDLRVQGARLGLKDHVLKCGDITREFGAVIVLEDDLVLSPRALSFVEQALPPSMAQERVAALSLYNFQFNEFGLFGTMRSEMSGDVFYAMTGSSWGQVWWKEKWLEFRDWFEGFDPSRHYRVPQSCRNWPATSWKKYFNMFLADRGYYTAVPLYSYALNPGAETGTHTAGLGPWFSEVSVVKERVHLRPLEDSMRLDPFLEYETDDSDQRIPDGDVPLSSVELDLTGVKTKADIVKPYVLTRRPQPKGRIAEFDADLGNPLLAALLGLRGKGLSLVEAGSFDDSARIERSASELRCQFPWLGPRALVRLAAQVAAQSIRRKLLP